MSDKPSGFFSRWQQRREQVAKELQESINTEKSENNSVIDHVPNESNTTAEKEISQVENEHAESSEKLLTAEELPDPDKIEIGGSFAVFMGKNIDPLAKKTALRALWKQPHYSEIDGLMEYALDYSNQPLLTAEASSELVKKVFSKILETEDKNQENTAQNAKVNHESSSCEPSDEDFKQASETQTNNEELQLENAPNEVSGKLNEKYQSPDQNVPDEQEISAEDVIKSHSG